MDGHILPPTVLFVYGTLKTDLPNHFILAGGSRFLGRATTVDKWPLVVYTKYNIPYILDAKGQGHEIRGEVYEVSAGVLESLDILEQHPTMYRRQRITVRLADSERIDCESYLLPDFNPDMLKENLLNEYFNVPEKHYVLPTLRPAGSCEYLIATVKQ